MIFTPEANVNIEATAQRTDILHYMDVTKEAAKTEEERVYCQLGAGCLSMTESPSAQTKERKYINEKSKRKNIASYAPSFAFEMLLMFNNPAIRKVYEIYTQRKTGTNTIISMVTVDKFDTAVSGYYPARRGNYAVEVSSCDDDDDMIIKGNFNGQGDEAIGWFNPETGVWSATSPSEAAASNTEQTETEQTDEGQTDPEETETN